MAETIWKAGDGRGDAAKDLRIFAFEDGRLLRYSPGIETAFWGSLFKDVVSQNRYSRCILEFVFTSFLFAGALIWNHLRGNETKSFGGNFADPKMSRGDTI